MVTRKYTGDYRLENVLDSRGKMKTVSVYSGAFFRFTESGERLRRTKSLAAVLTVLSAAAGLIPLFINTPIVHNWFVTVPFVCGLLPLAWEIMSVFLILTAKERVKREERDKMTPRLTLASLLVLILTVISLAGQLWFCIRNAVCAADMAVTACTAVLILVSGLLFLQKKPLQMEQVPSE